MWFNVAIAGLRILWMRIFHPSQLVLQKLTHRVRAELQAVQSQISADKHHTCSLVDTKEIWWWVVAYNTVLHLTLKYGKEGFRPLGSQQSNKIWSVILIETYNDTIHLRVDLGYRCVHSNRFCDVSAICLLIEDGQSDISLHSDWCSRRICLRLRVSLISYTDTTLKWFYEIRCSVISFKRKISMEILNLLLALFFIKLITN